MKSGTLAKRAAEAGQENVGGMAATIYNEADGVTPDEVMTIAALKNIGEGSGTAMDAARVVRKKGATAAEMGLPPKSALVWDADGISRLSDTAFGMVANGRASEKNAAAVGRVVENVEVHADILGLLGKIDPPNDAQREIIAWNAAADTVSETQESLFGDEQVGQSLYAERARILDGAVKELRKDKATLARLQSQSATIEGAGNKLGAHANEQRIMDDNAILDYLSRQWPVKFASLDQAIRFVDTARSGNAPAVLKSEDGVLSAQRGQSGGFVLTVQKRGGKPYILSPAVRKLVGDFQARSGPYTKAIETKNLRPVLEAYKDTLGSTFIADAHKDEAREITGDKIPDLDGDQGSLESRAPENRGEVERDAPISNAQMAEIAAEAEAELDATGMAGKLTARVVSKIEWASARAQGAYREGRGAIEVRPDAEGGTIGVVRHEIIHALRDKNLWGSNHGLFTKAEWQGLVREARADKTLMEETRSRYPDRDGAALHEEAVAEMYSRWREGGAKADSPAFARVRAIFEALANAFRGQGFQGAARTMQAISDGKFGTRGNSNPSGPGGGAKVGREARGTERVASQVRRVLAGEKISEPIALTRSPEVRRELWGKNIPVLIPQGVVWKAGSDKHGMTADQIIAAIDGLSDPVMVFDSATVADSLVALVDVTGEARPVVVAMRYNHKVGRIEVALVASIHRKDAAGQISNWLNQGLLRYINKRNGRNLATIQRAPIAQGWFSQEPTR